MPKDHKKLEEEVRQMRNSLRTDKMDISFGELKSMYEAEEITVSPAFQRLFRWTDYQKTRFIESLLLGIPVPPIFVAEAENGIWELVDGLQRVSTVLSFLGALKNENGRPDTEKNNWALEEGELVSSLRGYKFRDLPMRYQLNLKRTPCRVEIIKWDSEYDMRYELFNRLNTGGTPLTAQEIRNSIFRSESQKFYEFLDELAETPDFVELTGIHPKKRDEMYLQELVLRFLSLYRKDESDIKFAISKHMTEVMRDMVQQESLPYEEYRDVFTKSVTLLKSITGKEIFRNNYIFSTAFYDVIMKGVSENIETYSTAQELLKQKIEEVKQDEVLQKISSRGGGNSISRVQKRIHEAKRIFGNGE
jgi:hypothetical protein